MKNPYLYPLYIILFVFILDKVACIPNFRDLGKRDYKAGQNVILGLDAVWKENQERQNNGNHIAVVTGSSRSEIFHLWKNIPLDTNLSRNEIYFETRTAVKAAELLYMYMVVDSMRQAGFRPNVLFLEFSEEMFNLNSPRSFDSAWNEMILNEEQLIEAVPFLKGKYFRDGLFQILFPSYHYHFQPIKALSGGNKSSNDVAQYYINLASLQNHKRDFTKAEEGFAEQNFPISEYQTRIVSYTNELFQNFLMRNYKYSPYEESIFALLVHHIEKNKIPTVIWEPQIHPYYQNLRAQKTGGALFENLTKKYVDPNSKYIRVLSLNNKNTKCTTYTDSSHVSPICVPEIANQLLKAAKDIDSIKE